ncbi:Rgi2 protein [Saccharomycopsis crataegensis]|uniref:Rgi2 protein n=1 Tax=Saccharomycopsis crataegensis TaxID=43959 RepID=A0AAV5QM86_9ASCO|nr:Rgi2 protein [Saccharomycopsis crataegensis]
MSDILSTIEKTLAEAADPSLKKKKNKKSKQQKKNELRNFDNLDQFRDFLKMESTSDYEEKVHAHLSYFPPFVMQSCHNDPEKIKPTMNKNNKKFVRRLSQHVNKHLIDDIKKNSDFGDEIAFEEIDESDTFDKLVWHFVDANEHESNGKKFKLEMDVECHNDNATVEVDYRAYPC